MIFPPTQLLKNGTSLRWSYLSYLPMVTPLLPVLVFKTTCLSLHIPTYWPNALGLPMVTSFSAITRVLSLKVTRKLLLSPTFLLKLTISEARLVSVLSTPQPIIRPEVVLLRLIIRR